MVLRIWGGKNWLIFSWFVTKKKSWSKIQSWNLVNICKILVVLKVLVDLFSQWRLEWSAVGIAEVSPKNFVYFQ